MARKPRLDVVQFNQWLFVGSRVSHTNAAPTPQPDGYGVAQSGQAPLPALVRTAAARLPGVVRRVGVAAFFVPVPRFATVAGRAGVTFVGAERSSSWPPFNNRLPEAFGGYERAVTRFPVQYPTACCPQAWSAGTPLLFRRTMLGLEPTGDNLIVNPALPKKISHIELLNISGRWGLTNAFARETAGLEKHQRLHPPLSSD